MFLVHCLRQSSNWRDVMRALREWIRFTVIAERNAYRKSRERLFQYELMKRHCEEDFDDKDARKSTLKSCIPAKTERKTTSLSRYDIPCRVILKVKRNL